MTFQRERIWDAWQELLPLLAKNHAETGALQSGEFQPDGERFMAMDQAEVARLYTARNQDGELVGYAVFFVIKHMHYGSTQWALQDVLYFLPEYRGISSVRFLKWTDQELRSLGVDVICRHVSEKRDYSRTLKRLGYQPVETAYMRRL